MILAAILLGLGATLLVGFWRNIVDWLKKGMQKVKEAINMVVYGSKVFVKKMREAIQEIAKHYSQDNQGKWHETVVTREIDESEVPADIRAKAARMQNMDVDITKELELQLA